MSIYDPYKGKWQQVALNKIDNTDLTIRNGLAEFQGGQDAAALLIHYDYAQNNTAYTVDVANNALTDNVDTYTVNITDSNGVVTTKIYTFVAGAPAANQIQIGVDAATTETNIAAIITALANVSAAIVTGKAQINPDTALITFSHSTSVPAKLTLATITDATITPTGAVQVQFLQDDTIDPAVPNVSFYNEPTSINFVAGKNQLKWDIAGQSGRVILVNMANSGIRKLSFVVIDRNTGGN